MQTVMQDLQLHLNYVTIYVSTYEKSFHTKCIPND